MRYTYNEPYKCPSYIDDSIIVYDDKKDTLVDVYPVIKENEELYSYAIYIRLNNENDYKNGYYDIILEFLLSFCKQRHYDNIIHLCYDIDRVTNNSGLDKIYDLAKTRHINRVIILDRTSFDIDNNTLYEDVIIDLLKENCKTIVALEEYNSYFPKFEV